MEIAGPPIVAFIVVDGVLGDTFSDSFFELGGFEEGVFVGDSGKCLVGFKDSPGHFDVDIHASLEIETQSAQHYGNQAAGASATYQVEIIAWFWSGVSTGGFAFAFDIEPVHQLLED